MAGRGTDILLGGNPEAMTRDHCLREKLAIPYIAAPAVIGADSPTAESAQNMVLFQQEGKIFQVPAEQWKPIYNQYVEQCRTEHDEVIALGGLHILARNVMKRGASTTSFADAPAGRAIRARRRFFLSLEDDLLRVLAANA